MEEQIILASNSPRRHELLSKIGIRHTVEPSFLEEKIEEGLSFGQLVEKMAYQKAKAVAKIHDRGIVLGADTIVVLDEDILGKPSSEEEAKEMLLRLSGKWHKVFTGIALIDITLNRCIKDFVESRVKFKNLTNKEIENYVKTGEPMDKAGSYGIQGKGALLVEKIEGCYYNIVGLPLFKLNLMLQDFGMEIL